MATSAELQDRDADGAEGPAGRSLPARAEARDDHENEHHQQVFDDQPSDRHVTADGVEKAFVLEPAQQHDGARDGEGDAEHQRGRRGPTEGAADDEPEQRGHDALEQRPWDGDRFHLQQIAGMEMKPDPEHQEHHADLGQLGRDLAVAHEARGPGPDEHAREEIPDDGGEPQQARQYAENPRGREGGGHGREERRAVEHALSYSACAHNRTPTS